MKSRIARFDEGGARLYAAFSVSIGQKLRAAFQDDAGGLSHVITDTNFFLRKQVLAAIISYIRTPNGDFYLVFFANPLN